MAAHGVNASDNVSCLINAAAHGGAHGGAHGAGVAEEQGHDFNLVVLLILSFASIWCAGNLLAL
jgi:TctA family transporter